MSSMPLDPVDADLDVILLRTRLEARGQIARVRALFFIQRVGVLFVESDAPLFRTRLDA